jgi:hypothetical protein
MQKRSVLKKGMIVGIVFLFCETSMAIKMSDVGRFDQIDQQNSNTGSSIGSWFIYDDHIQAQEFKPYLDVLTRVAVYGDREGNPPNGLIVSIRDSLTGQDLTSIEISQDSIPENNPDWIMADFSDIHVTPGQSYYLVCRTIGGSYNPDELYAWWRTPDTNYPNGTAYHSMDNGTSWFTNDDDFLFQTYGRMNSPPNMQTFQGPTWGIMNVKYNFSTNVTDIDGDNIFCKWDWGDGNITAWSGPYSPGETVYANHSWSQKGPYDIKVKLKDEYGLEGNWSDPHTITIYELKKTFMIGRYANWTEENGFVLIDAVNLLTVHFKPFELRHHTPTEQIIFSDTYKGFKTKHFVLGEFNIAG